VTAGSTARRHHSARDSGNRTRSGRGAVPALPSQTHGLSQAGFRRTQKAWKCSPTVAAQSRYRCRARQRRFSAACPLKRTLRRPEEWLSSGRRAPSQQKSGLAGPWRAAAAARATDSRQHRPRARWRVQRTARTKASARPSCRQASVTWTLACARAATPGQLTGRLTQAPARQRAHRGTLTPTASDDRRRGLLPVSVTADTAAAAFCMLRFLCVEHGVTRTERGANLFFQRGNLKKRPRYQNRTGSGSTPKSRLRDDRCCTGTVRRWTCLFGGSGQAQLIQAAPAV
jgi:hypothetical protein